MTGRFFSLSSGSSGNALFLEIGTERFLLDNGLPLRTVERYLIQRSISPESITASLVTHEHNDHGGGVAKFALKYNTPVFATKEVVEILGVTACNVRLFTPDTPFSVNGVTVNPFSVSHDAAAPVGFRLDWQGGSLALLTDLGRFTDSNLRDVDGVDALFVEANYDPNRLSYGPYPMRLKDRIRSDQGHLSNHQTGEFLSCLKAIPKHLFVCHLSRENNSPDLVRRAFSNWSIRPERVRFAYQGIPSPMVEL